MNVLIIEDESRAANRLERMIKRLRPDYIIKAKVESVAEAIELLSHENDIQLIFADIELGDGVSFEVFEQLHVEIPIIFTTAFDQYAIEAFKVNGVDYLLKPIEETELEKAILKFSKSYDKQVAFDIQSLMSSLDKLKPQKYKNRFLVKIGTKLKSIPIEEVAAFYTMSSSSFLLSKNQRNYNLDDSLDTIMKSLNPQLFFKISRQHIVSLDSIEDIHVYSNSRLVLAIKGLENHELIVARNRVQAFKGWLG